MEAIQINTKKPYGPSLRNYLEAPLNSKVSFSKDGSTYTKLPDNVEDDIAVNNIAWQEFDYTYDNSDHEQF